MSEYGDEWLPSGLGWAERGAYLGKLTGATTEQTNKREKKTERNKLTKEEM